MASTSDKTRRPSARPSWSQGNISFHDEVKSKAVEYDGSHGPPERWTAALESRLDIVKARMWEAQKSWSAEQEIYVAEYEELMEMRSSFKKFSKRRHRDQKKEGSRFKVAAASISQANSDDEAEVPGSPKVLLRILRRSSTSRVEQENEQESRLGYASMGSDARKLTRAQTSTSFVPAFARRRSLRINSEDEMDVESPTAGFSAGIFRRASTSKSAGASGDESFRPGIVNTILRRASTGISIDAEKRRRRIRKHEKR